MTTIDKLIALQQHDTLIRNIERELHDIPVKKETQESTLNGHKQSVAAAETALKAKQSEIKNVELEITARRDKITKLRQQQMTLKSNKEFQAMELEIKTLTEGISELEDKELSLMDEQDRLGAELAIQKESLGNEQKTVQAQIKLLDERLAVLNKDLSEEQSKRETCAADIDPIWLANYSKVLTRKVPALVPVEDGICGGCHMKLPPYVVHGTKKPDEMVVCNFCGRMLH